MPSNESALDLTIAHQIGLIRFRNGSANRLEKLMRDLDQDLQDELAQRLPELVNSGRINRNRIDRTINAITRTRTRSLREVSKELRSIIGDFINQEVVLLHNMNTRALPAGVPLTQVTGRAITSTFDDNFIQGQTYNQWVDRLIIADAFAINSLMKIGLVDGETSEEILRSIVGSKRLGRRDGAVRRTTVGYRTLVNTSIAAAASMASDLYYRANSNLIDGLLWSAVLDGKTSAVCRSRSGIVFKVNAGPRPPAHANCRSVMIPIYDGKKVADASGIDFAQRTRNRVGASWKSLSSTIRRREIAKTRNEWIDSRIGDPTKEINYTQWLKKQPAEMQDEILGRTKGILFRQGGLTLDRFVDKQGSDINLTELRVRESETFKRLGL